MMKVEIKEVKISEIKLNPDNPRRISKQDMDRLVKSLTEFPDMLSIREIVVDETMTILGGNMRYLALKKSGAKAATAKIVTGLTKEQKREFVIKDNSNFGEYDFDALANGWSDLPLADWGVDLPEDWLGGDKSEPADAEPQIDRAEELNKTWGVKLGDLWQIGEHRLLCGDSTKKEDVGRVMGEEKATCVFTDPPYGVSIGKKNKFLNAMAGGGGANENDLAMDDMKPEELKVMLLAAFTTFRAFMADDCSVFVCSPQGGGLGMMMMMMMQEAGLEVRHILNWIKNSPTFSMGRLDYDYQHEPILYTWTKTHKRYNKGEFQTSLWSVDKPRANKEHPTMKPIELPTNAFLNHTDVGDITADIFGGNGTTLLACENLHKKCRMIEISPAYCAVILQRMTDAFPGIEIKKVK
jgi:DNA modification methylase